MRHKCIELFMFMHIKCGAIKIKCIILILLAIKHFVFTTVSISVAMDGWKDRFMDGRMDGRMDSRVVNNFDTNRQTELLHAL